MFNFEKFGKVLKKYKEYIIIYNYRILLIEDVFNV